MQETLIMKIRWRRDRLPTPVFLGFPGGSAGKESACNAGDHGSILGLGRSPGKGKVYPLQYSDLEKSMNPMESMGLQRVRHDWATFTSLHSMCPKPDVSFITVVRFHQCSDQSWLINQEITDINIREEEEKKNVLWQHFCNTSGIVPVTTLLQRQLTTSIGTYFSAVPLE